MSDLSSEEVVLLHAIGGSTTPVGSRRAADALRGEGIVVSESTVSRLLRRLDQQKLTEAQEAKGRILTDDGRRLLLTLNERDRREQILRDASGVSDINDLLDLLYARRGVEREAARAAARRVTDADIVRLQALVVDHQARIDERRIIRHGALTFHQVIGEMANNRLLSAMMEVLFEPVMDQTEAILDVIIGSHHSEQQSVEEHLEIMQAIVARDPERADAAMAAHLGRLIDETEAFAASHQGDLVERMLTWMHDGQPMPGRRPG